MLCISWHEPSTLSLIKVCVSHRKLQLSPQNSRLVCLTSCVESLERTRFLTGSVLVERFHFLPDGRNHKEQLVMIKNCWSEDNYIQELVQVMYGEISYCKSYWRVMSRCRDFSPSVEGSSHNIWRTWITMHKRERWACPWLLPLASKVTRLENFLFLRQWWRRGASCLSVTAATSVPQPSVSCTSERTMMEQTNAVDLVSEHTGSNKSRGTISQVFDKHFNQRISQHLKVL